MSTRTSGEVTRSPRRGRVSYPGCVRLLRGKTRSGGPESSDDADAPGLPDPSAGGARAHNPGKGRPTPRRREAEGHKRGPAPPPPRNQREAMRRFRGSKKERRKDSAVRRERMMAGDERYLLPRDRGPHKAYARDLVDSRRNIMGLFMPLAAVILLVIFIPVPAVQQYASLLSTAMLLTMLVEGVLLGRLVNKQVRERFPDTAGGRLGLGFYAFTRATQLRRLRVPKPRVSPGARV
ncbi:MAG: DUF3043 domain-containing protein [Pseudonocardiaceae bacterium]|nr:DUF3043 domain-containing protein [Pseudonocardiaceae bacterium]